jgi:DNA-directed RNA polymerase subunit RPC12/RpoP
MSNYKYYMETCSKCGDDAEMMYDNNGDCPQCGNGDVVIYLNPDYKEEN